MDDPQTNAAVAGPDRADLDELVGEWLSLPDVAQALGTDVTRARSIVQDRRIVGVRRGERPTFQVPARFLVPFHLIDPSHARRPDDDGRLGVLASLQGTIVLLADAGFDDAAIIEWLFTPDAELGESPLDALIAGRKSHVRRVAQTLA